MSDTSVEVRLDGRKAFDFDPDNDEIEIKMRGKVHRVRLSDYRKVDKKPMGNREIGKKPLDKEG